MTKQTRVILFWLLVAVFLITSPIAILYALDYSYDKQTKRFVQNGAFFFRSEPRGADIYIDGKSKKTTPRLIKRLSPQDYAIEIVKKDYQSWKKELRIDSGLVAEEKNILLIKKSPELEFIAESKSLPQLSVPQISDKLQKTIESLSLKTNTFKIIPSLSRHTALIEYNKTDAKNKHASQAGKLSLLDSNGKLTTLAENVIDAKFSSDNKKILWQTKNEIWVYWLEDEFVQPYKKASDKEFITRFNEAIDQTSWYEGDNRHIIFTIGNNIKIIEIGNRGQKNINDIVTISEPQILSQNKLLYILSADKLYKTKLGEDFLF